MRFSTELVAACAAMAFSLAGSLPAKAVEFTGRFSAWVPPENPKCTCRFKGQHLELGALRCIATPNGPRMHQCVTVENVTSWRPSEQPCPQASAGDAAVLTFTCREEASRAVGTWRSEPRTGRSDRERRLHRPAQELIRTEGVQPSDAAHDDDATRNGFELSRRKGAGLDRGTILDGAGFESGALGCGEGVDQCHVKISMGEAASWLLDEL